MSEPRTIPGQPRASVSLATPPPSGRGAIAVFELRGDIDAALAALGVRPVGVGESRLRDLAGIDHAVIARWTAHAASIMPHAGPAVIAELMGLFEKVGLRCREPDPSDAYPEASSWLEAHMLAALARAASPLAIDLLLDQPPRWHAAIEKSGGGTPEAVARLADESTRARWVRLSRLIDPPLVVALGTPNIGKSTLLNALAGRSVSIVADLPGTTRDHVGALLDLGGLVVRYFDTPGIGHAALPVPGANAALDPHADADAEAERIALGVAATADLILLCSDPTQPAVEPPPGVPALRVGLRSDLGPPRAPVDLAVCVRAGGEESAGQSPPSGLELLVSTLRDTLVSPADLGDPSPWAFWKSAGRNAPR